MKDRPRRIDYDECLRLRSDGWTLQRLADRYHVTTSAVWLATNDAGRARCQERVRARRGSCGDCGSAMPYSTWYRDRRRGSVPRCPRCATIWRDNPTDILTVDA